MKARILVGAAVVAALAAVVMVGGSTLSAESTGARVGATDTLQSFRPHDPAGASLDESATESVPFLTGAPHTAGAGVTSARTSAAVSAGTPATPLIAGWRGEAAVKLGGSIIVRGTTARPAGVIRIERKVGDAWLPAASVSVGEAPNTSRGAWSTSVMAPTVTRFETYRARWVNGRTTSATVALPRIDVHRLHTYSVITRGRLKTDVDDFATAAAAIYGDKRGWKQAHHRFSRVRSGGDFTLALVEAGRVPSFDGRCSTHFSCRSGRFVIINEKNWLDATPAFVGDLATYRSMVINHETGHWLGLGHRYCGGTGRQAPVMQQQSKGMQGCQANGWPTSAELEAVRR